MTKWEGNNNPVHIRQEATKMLVELLVQCMEMQLVVLRLVSKSIIHGHSISCDKI